LLLFPILCLSHGVLEGIQLVDVDVLWIAEIKLDLNFSSCCSFGLQAAHTPAGLDCPVELLPVFGLESPHALPIQ
jgi:hypothetical protein